MPELAFRGGLPVCQQMMPAIQQPPAEPLSCVSFDEFCTTFASYHECVFGVAVPYGRAMSVALQALFPLGAVVARTAYSASPFDFPSDTKPAFLDILEDSYTVDTYLLEKTMQPGLDVLIAEHLAGIPCNMDSVLYAGDNNNCVVIEDCSQAVGAEWAGTRVGAFGSCSCFHLEGVEMDVITTDDAELAERLAQHSSGHGRTVDMELYFERLFERDAVRQELAAYLRTKLDPMPGVWPLKLDGKASTASMDSFIIRYHSDAFDGADKATFVDALNAEGIPATGGPVSQGAQSIVAARAEEEEAVWLPGWILDDRKQVNSLIEAIGKIQQNKAELLEKP